MLASSVPIVAAAQSTVADTVYKNGYVYKVDAYWATAQAFAVKDGKFIGVGSNDDMKVFTGKSTKTVDLKGKMVLPGLVDTHIHPEKFGVRVKILRVFALTPPF